MQLFTDPGPNELENQHAYLPLDPLHFPQSSIMVIRLAKVTIVFHILLYPSADQTYINNPSVIYLLILQG